MTHVHVVPVKNIKIATGNKIMLNQNFTNTLKIISQRFSENDILWAIVGSTNLALQGLDISPRDLDIIVTIENLAKMKNIFPEYEVFDIEEMNSKVTGSYWRTLMKINGIEIEILGEKDKGIYAHRLLAGQKTEVSLDGFSVFCLALEAEMKAYQETGRQNRVEIIEKFLSSKK